MDLDKSQIVYQRLCTMLDVAQMMDAPPPQFIVIPRDDFLALKMHKDAPAWLRFELGSTNPPEFYGVPLVLKEKLDWAEDHRKVIASRFDHIRALMHGTNKSGRRVLDLQPLYIMSEEADSLRILKKYDRATDGFDLDRMTYLTDKMEIAGALRVMEQCARADLAHDVALSQLR